MSAPGFDERIINAHYYYYDDKGGIFKSGNYQKGIFKRGNDQKGICSKGEIIRKVYHKRK